MGPFLFKPHFKYFHNFCLQDFDLDKLVISECSVVPVILISVFITGNYL